MTGARKVQAPPGAPNHVRLLLAIRQQNNWTQKQLAIELEVRRNTICRWETGLSEPSAHSQKLINLLFAEKVMHAAVALPANGAAGY